MSRSILFNQLQKLGSKVILTSKRGNGFIEIIEIGNVLGFVRVRFIFEIFIIGSCYELWSGIVLVVQVLTHIIVCTLIIGLLIN
jgi:hypothetical protein